jgi:Zn ribbon nucleic-acid-binding protein
MCDSWRLKRSRFISGARWIHDAGMAQTPESKRREKAMATVCKHPRVRIVSRHDDAEFVECLECGEVFDSEEFHDMEIEETVETEQAESEY